MKFTYTFFSSLQSYLNPTEQMLACGSCSSLLASVFHGVPCENSAPELWQWIIFCLLAMHCTFQFKIPVWFLDATFVLLLPAAAPVMRLISARPVGYGKCNWATAWAGFMFLCVSEHCQKQDPELCWPSLRDCLILLVVNITYRNNAWGTVSITLQQVQKAEVMFSFI